MKVFFVIAMLMWGSDTPIISEIEVGSVAGCAKHAKQFANTKRSDIPNEVRLLTVTCRIEFPKAQDAKAR